MIYLFLLIIIFAAQYIYTQLTFTEGWNTENWSTFFKKLITFKIKYK